eukprot:344769_1
MMNRMLFKCYLLLIVSLLSNVYGECTYYDKYPTDLCSIKSASTISQSKSSKNFLCVYDEINLNWNIKYNLYDSLDCESNTLVSAITILCDETDTKCHCNWRPGASGHHCNTATVRNRGYIYGECDMNSYTDEIIVTDECVNGVEYSCKSDTYDALFYDTLKCSKSDGDFLSHYSYDLNECATVLCNNTFDKIIGKSKYIEYSTYFGDDSNAENCSVATEWNGNIVPKECMPFGVNGGSYQYSCQKKKKTVSVDLWYDMSDCHGEPDFSQTVSEECANNSFIAIKHCDAGSTYIVFFVYIIVLIIMLQLQ